MLGLVTLLYFSDRKYEIGVYFCLGARKMTVFFQTLLELLIPFVIAARYPQVQVFFFLIGYLDI